MQQRFTIAATKASGYCRCIFHAYAIQGPAIFAGYRHIDRQRGQLFWSHYQLASSFANVMS